ncbi:MAG: FecR domain-containing protein, partial [Planctomycetota bacterium]
MSQAESLDQLITLHLEGGLSQAQSDRLAAHLAESEEARQAFWQAIQLHHAAVELADRHWGQMSLVVDTAGEPGTDGPVMPQIQWSARSRSSRSSKTLGVIGYVGRQAIRRYALAISSVAAALVLAVILVFMLRGMGSDSAVREVVVDDPPAAIDQPADPQAMQVVATLTAESDAVWDRRPGKDLFAGQQFVLTKGYAEIATASGTEIILEAPSVIELTDNENMIVLHMGKLVGICEVPSSKGFVVRTPNLDVEDLGTRFGVKVSEQGDSEVHVLEGSVLLTSKSDPKALHTLVVGQAVEVSASQQITELQIEPKQFTTLIGHHHGQPRVAGSKAVWLDGVPPDLRLGGSESDMLQIIREQENFTLTQDINVNLIPGESFTRPLPPEAKQLDQIKAGQRVSVYLLHLDPERQ